MANLSTQSGNYIFHWRESNSSPKGYEITPYQGYIIPNKIEDIGIIQLPELLSTKPKWDDEEYALLLASLGPNTNTDMTPLEFFDHPPVIQFPKNKKQK